jgi:NAD-dependent DNA ligase
MSEDPAFYYANLAAIRRAYDELVGLCRGILFDGQVSDAEAVRLHAWCETYPYAALEWPGDVIVRRIRAVLDDGEIDDAERDALKEELLRLTGQRGDSFDVPTELPLTMPEPAVTFPGRLFCLTGVFTFGRRGHCEHAIMSLGGRTQKHVNSKVNYVVIGSHASERWIHSTHGTKIQGAVGYQQSGHDIAIISERQWTRYLLPALEALPR